MARTDCTFSRCRLYRKAKACGECRRFLLYGSANPGATITGHKVPRTPWARRADLVGEAAMRKWWKKIGVLAGGLMGLAGLLSPVHAQHGLPGGDGFPGGVFPGAPQPPPGPDFPNPSAPPSEPVSPFSLTNDGSPNAWTDGGPP